MEELLEKLTSEEQIELYKLLDTKYGKTKYTVAEIGYTRRLIEDYFDTFMANCAEEGVEAVFILDYDDYFGVFDGEEFVKSEKDKKYDFLDKIHSGIVFKGDFIPTDILKNTDFCYIFGIDSTKELVTDEYRVRIFKYDAESG
jgi:hypothetical protein